MPPQLPQQGMYPLNMPGGAPQQFNPVPLPPQAPSPYQQLPPQPPAYSQAQMAPPPQGQQEHPGFLSQALNSVGGIQGLAKDAQWLYHAAGGLSGLKRLVNSFRGK